MCFDYQNKLWVSNKSELVVLEDNLSIKKSFYPKKSKKFNEISEPWEGMSTLRKFDDMVRIFWIGTNFEIYEINTKELTILRTFKNFMVGGIFFINFF